MHLSPPAFERPIAIRTATQDRCVAHITHNGEEVEDDSNFKHGAQAKIIADSISPAGYRVTTMEVVMWRAVLAEFNTHRVFSRNSASSRAIPFRKQVERVKRHPAIPVKWASEQKGMQGGDELDELDRQDAEQEWLYARDAAVEGAQALADLGVHKSIVNRLLEPFMWHTVIVTSTEWQGFWDQRCSELAQPEIKVAAELMREAYEASEPTLVDYDEWHLPYIEGEDWDAAIDMSDENGGDNNTVVDIIKSVSVARSARVSFLNHDGTRELQKDLDLYYRLVSADPLHASPLEHVCTPAEYSEVRAGEVLGNLTGWHQMRHQVENA